MARKKSELLPGVKVDHGLCEICEEREAIYSDLEKGKPVKVCEECARRPIGKTKTKVKKKKK